MNAIIVDVGGNVYLSSYCAVNGEQLLYHYLSLMEIAIQQLATQQ